MDLIFREARPDDIEAMFSIRGRTRDNALSREHLASLGITPEAIAGDLASGHVKSLVCQHGSELVGFCNADARTAEVLVLAVLPDFEGRGIGRWLLSDIGEWLRTRGHHEIWLAASSDPKVRAHGFYRSQGWRPNGKVLEYGDEILTL